MKICFKCGAQNNDNNNFCSSCGEKLENIIFTSSQLTTKASECQITFYRPIRYVGMAVSFRIKIDNCMNYKLKNGREIKIKMSPGQHFVEVSVFGNPRKKQFNIHVTSDMTFIFKPNNALALLWPIPVIVTDINGREY